MGEPLNKYTDALQRFIPPALTQVVSRCRDWTRLISCATQVTLIERPRWEMKPGLKDKKVEESVLVSPRRPGGVGVY